MRPYRLQWVLMGPYWSLCVLMYYNESVWVLKCPYASLGSFCVLKRPYGSRRFLIGPYASLWI